MRVIGLTGSIGMGKSFVAKLFSQNHVPVFNADDCVRVLYRKGGEAVPHVKKLFPEVIKNGEVDKNALSKALLKQPKKWQQLESMIHPLVREKEQRFIKQCKTRGEELCILEVPLLYETKADKLCDAVIVVTAPWFVQRARVLRRKGMTIEKYQAITQRQTSDKEKVKRADYIVRTGLSKGHTAKQVEAIRSLILGQM